jgi:short subunit dehydrogenase-like uncharacterized protein
MMQSCIRTQTHYLDITGEVAIFELAQSMDAQAKAAGVVLCPGVGFDVIPTDCVALGYKVKEIDFGDGRKQAMTIPWGDISTAFHTTGIPNVEAYIPAPRNLVLFSKLANRVRPLLGLKVVQDFLKAQVDKRVKGPNEEERATMPTFVWGQVRNVKGQVKMVRIKTANPYGFTIDSAVAVSRGLMAMDKVSGAYTPAKLMGSGFVETLPGSGRFIASQ